MPKKKTQNQIIPAPQALPVEPTGYPIRLSDGQVTDDLLGGDEDLLRFLETQIAMGCVHIASSLKTIRDRSLYLYRGCDTMKAYCDEYIPMAYKTAAKYLQIADAIPTNLEKFQGASLNTLLTISRDEELALAANSDDPDVSELIKKAREHERKKAKAKLEEQQSVINGKDTMMEKLRASVKEGEEEIARLKATVQSIAQEKGLDPAAYTYVTQKKDAISLVEETYHLVAGKLATLSHIPQELMDAELTARLSYALSALRAAVNRVEDTFFVQLKVARDDIDVLPSSEHMPPCGSMPPQEEDEFLGTPF